MIHHVNYTTCYTYEQILLTILYILINKDECCVCFNAYNSETIRPIGVVIFIYAHNTRRTKYQIRKIPDFPEELSYPLKFIIS